MSTSLNYIKYEKFHSTTNIYFWFIYNSSKHNLIWKPAQSQNLNKRCWKWEFALWEWNFVLKVQQCAFISETFVYNYTGNSTWESLQFLLCSSWVSFLLLTLLYMPFILHFLNQIRNLGFFFFFFFFIIFFFSKKIFIFRAVG